MNIIVILCLFMVIPSQILPYESCEIKIVDPDGLEEGVIIVLDPESQTYINNSKSDVLYFNNNHIIFTMDNNASYIQTVIIRIYYMNGSFAYGVTQLIYR